MQNIVSLLFSLLFELTRSGYPERIQEPELVMEGVDSVKEYQKEADEGILVPIQLYHLKNVSCLLRPTDVVLDLGCGPATHLTSIAALYPEASFIGVDLSLEMLKRAEQRIEEKGIHNIELKQGDVCDLQKLDIPQPDLIQSHYCFHHLPDLDSLYRCFNEIGALSTDNTAIYLLDLCRLKSEKTMKNLVEYECKDAGDFLRTDYYNSLRASFSPAEFEGAFKRLEHTTAKMFVMKGAAIQMAIKTPKRVTPHDSVVNELKRSLEELPFLFRMKYHQVVSSFWLAGMESY